MANRQLALGTISFAVCFAAWGLISAFANNESDERYNCGMTSHEKFVLDMDAAGIVTAAYLGRFFWEGPAARSDQLNGPTLQDIITKTTVPLQWDSLASNYVVYPV